jgi:hypothetical protein
MTFSAITFARTNHCVETTDSIRHFPREQNPTLCVYGSTFTRFPLLFRSSTILFRASPTALSQANIPASAVIIPFLSITR